MHGNLNIQISPNVSISSEKFYEVHFKQKFSYFSWKLLGILLYQIELPQIVERCIASGDRSQIVTVPIDVSENWLPKPLLIVHQILSFHLMLKMYKETNWEKIYFYLAE